MTKAEMVENYMNRRIASLEHMDDTAKQKALLAELRRGIGRKPGDLPRLWGLLFEKLPESLLGKEGEPSKPEWAIYTAMTLYAYHQQGRDPKTDSVNDQNRGISAALSDLISDEDDLKRIQRRFNCFASSSDIAEAVTHLRGLISLLKSEGKVGLNYPGLAKDLYQFQFYDCAQKMRLHWGREFYRNLSNKIDNEKNNKEEAENV